MAEDALDVIMKRRVVQIFYHVSSGGFLQLPLDCGQLGPGHNPMAPRATPTTLWKVERGKWLAEALSALQRKRGLKNV